MSDQTERLAKAEAEVKRLRDGGKALGMVVKQQCDAALAATGLHDWIDEDGDGDWGAIWENLAELRPRLEIAEARLARVAALIRRDHIPEKHRHEDEGGPDVLTHCAGCGVDLDDEPCPYLAALALTHAASEASA